MLKRPSLVLPVTLPFVLHTCGDIDVGEINGKRYVRKSKKKHPGEYNAMNIVFHPSLICGILDDPVYTYIPYYDDTTDVFRNKNLKWNHLVQMFSGVKHLSDNDIVHRDLKPENFLLLNNGVIKIIDFGTSIRCTIGLIRGNENISSTYCYNAPEIYNNDSFNPFKADVFSMGVVLFECITKMTLVDTGGPHWMYKDYPNRVFHNFDNILDDFKITYTGDLSPELIGELMELIKIMIKHLNVDRITMTEASRRINEIIYKYDVEDQFV